MRAGRLADYVTQATADWPALTPGQVDRLAILLRSANSRRTNAAA
jgi:hypothetical protein